MVKGKGYRVLLRVVPQEEGTQQGTALQVERSGDPGLGESQRLAATPRLWQGCQVHLGRLDREDRSDDLHWLTVDTGVGAAQGLMTAHDLVQAGAQKPQLQVARQGEDGPDVVGGAARDEALGLVELLEKPQALLGERKRHRRPVAGDAFDRRSLCRRPLCRRPLCRRPLCRRPWIRLRQLMGKLRHGGSSEEGLQSQLEAEDVADA